MNSEMEELIRAASYLTSGAPAVEAVMEAAASGLKQAVSGELRESSTGSEVTPVVNVRLATQQRTNASVEEVFQNAMTPIVSGSSTADATRLAVETSKLLEVTRTAAAANVTPTSANTSTTAKSDSSITEQVVRTAGMMTGVGPIVMGLMKLFGSSDPEPLPALEKFQLPGSVSVEAGLSANRQINEIRYAQGGIPQVARDAGAQSSASPSIQVNIQALDSQSFLDRQDDIARAVREAMLHSNSLNDVVMEL